MQEKIKHYLTEVAQDESIQDTTDLFALQIIDSLDLIHLVDYLEKEFSIKIEGTEIVQDNFKDVSAIGRFVRSKQGGACG